MRSRHGLPDPSRPQPVPHRLDQAGNTLRQTDNENALPAPYVEVYAVTDTSVHNAAEHRFLVSGAFQHHCGLGLEGNVDDVAGCRGACLRKEHVDAERQQFVLQLSLMMGSAE